MTIPTDPHSETEIAPAEGGPPARMSADERVVRIAGRYDLLGMLGAGAMGTVYRARDVELDELVALKVLKKELAASPGMVERFRREVKLARRVTHRNVARTFDIGEHEGDRFLTMEYVDGEMLGSRLARAGRIPSGEATRIAADVCKGLAAAHESGVLHRDLKPENVILAQRDGRAVITDFGIARAFAEGEARKTSGMLVGTPAYMAPEQVEAAADLDARADLFALGAMLFELLTGTLPFQGDSALAIAAARLLRPAPDPRTVVPTLQPALAELVLKLLARRREDRPGSALDAAAALESIDATETRAPTSLPVVRVPGGGHDAHVKTLAVLPLLNLGPAEDAYLAQVLTEDLVDLLSVVPDMRVRPRGDTAGHQGAQRDVREVGRTLGVDVVVDGSVRRIGEQARVAVRLVTVADGFQLWAKRFDRPVNEVLAVADAAAEAIANALTARPVERTRQAAVDGRAQDLYLRGRYLLHRALNDVSRDAVAMLREAHARAPEDARIAGALALALARASWMTADAPELTREGRAMADEALRISPSLPEAHVARGAIHMTQNEPSAAAAELGIALVRAPNSVDALDALGRLLVEIGRIEEGIAHLTRALAEEPDFVAVRLNRARTYALAGRWDLAEADLEGVPEERADLIPFLLMKARLLLVWRDEADFAKELAAHTTGLTLPPFAQGALAGLLKVPQLRRAPTTADLDFIRANIATTLPIAKAVSPRRIAFNAQTAAEVLLVCGLEDEALSKIEEADTSGFFDLVWMDRLTLLDGVRKNPRFTRVRENVVVRAERALAALDNAARR